MVTARWSAKADTLPEAGAYVFLPPHSGFCSVQEIGSLDRALRKVVPKVELTQAFGKILLSGVFVISATAKLRDANGFQTHLANTIPVAPAIAGVMTRGAIVAEFLITMALWINQTTYIAFLCAFLLLSAFSAFIVYLLASNKRVSCACFGASARPVSGVHLGRNVALLLIAGFCVIASRGPASPSAFDYLLVLAPALISAAIVARLDDISTFFSSPSGEF